MKAWICRTPTETLNFMPTSRDEQGNMTYLLSRPRAVSCKVLPRIFFIFSASRAATPLQNYTIYLLRFGFRSHDVATLVCVYVARSLSHRVLDVSHHGRKGSEGVHGDLRLSARDAPEQGRLAGVRVTHKTHVRDCSQLEPVVPALSALPGNFLKKIDERGRRTVGAYDRKGSSISTGRTGGWVGETQLYSLPYING